MGWLNGIFSEWQDRSLNASVSSDSTGNNHELNKGISEKNRHENLFIIGDIGKCKEVMKKLGADDSSSEEEVTIYKKEIIDDNWHKTFKFYICGNEVGKCEEIYNKEEQSSFFFFFVDITDSESLNTLGKLLLDFKQKFKNETRRFFLILLKTDPQGGGDIKVDDAEEFCEKNELKFFGEIDMENNTWGFEKKESFYRTIGNIEQLYRDENDYKLGKNKYHEESGELRYEVEKDCDIWGMFLCGVKREEIRNELMHNHYIWGMKLTGSYY